MRALKALVIGMGVLIVIGVVVLVYAIIDRAGKTNGLETMAAQSQIDLPAGAQIVETSIGDGRIVVRLSLADGSQRLLLIDADTGGRIGAVNLKPGS